MMHSSALLFLSIALAGVTLTQERVAKAHEDFLHRKQRRLQSKSQSLQYDEDYEDDCVCECDEDDEDCEVDEDCECEEEDPPPNFIVIFPDDFGMNDAYYTNGLAPIETTNIDNLAQAGLRLTNYYTGPVCSPARCMLMTGRHMMRNGCHSDTGNDAWGLNLNEILIPEVLMSAPVPYYNAIFGKWHLGHYSWEHMPTMRGFDVFNGFLGGGVGQADHYDGDTYDWWLNTDIDRDGEGTYVGEMAVSQMYDLIETTAECYGDGGDDCQPFFAYLPMSLPHGPYGAPTEYTELYEDEWGEDSDMTLWLAELKMLDDLVGYMYDYLDNFGILDNTYIIFAGDHGAPQNEPDDLDYSRDYPFYGGKGNIWEGGVRTPAFIYNPAFDGSTLDTPTSAVDWLATIAELAGVTSCDMPDTDGLSVVDLWENGEDSNEDRVLLIEVTGKGCRRRREDELEDGQGTPPAQYSQTLGGGGGDLGAAIRYGNYKYAVSCISSDGDVGDEYMFDVVNYPYEYGNNLFDSGLDDDAEEAYEIMKEALADYAGEAYPQEPDWNDGVYCEDCNDQCGGGDVDGVETVLPWTSCSSYVLDNGYEYMSWTCSSYCTDAYGGTMPSSGVTYNRAAGNNGNDCEGGDQAEESDDGAWIPADDQKSKLGEIQESWEWITGMAVALLLIFWTLCRCRGKQFKDQMAFAPLEDQGPEPPADSLEDGVLVDHRAKPESQKTNLLGADANATSGGYGAITATEGGDAGETKPTPGRGHDVDGEDGNAGENDPRDGLGDSALVGNDTWQRAIRGSSEEVLGRRPSREVVLEPDEVRPEDEMSEHLPREKTPSQDSLLLVSEGGAQPPTTEQTASDSARSPYRKEYPGSPGGRGHAVDDLDVRLGDSDTRGASSDGTSSPQRHRHKFGTDASQVSTRGNDIPALIPGKHRLNSDSDQGSKKKYKEPFDNETEGPLRSPAFASSRNAPAWGGPKGPKAELEKAPEDANRDGDALAKKLGMEDLRGHFRGDSEERLSTYSATNSAFGGNPNEDIVARKGSEGLLPLPQTGGAKAVLDDWWSTSRKDTKDSQSKTGRKDTKDSQSKTGDPYVGDV